MTQSIFGARPLHKAEGAKGEASMACSLLPLCSLLYRHTHGV